MSEIEKMYENAGIDYEERYNNCTLNKEGQCELKCSCDMCKYSEEKYIYPPFTAEKQLRLTTFIGLHYGFQMFKNEAFDYIIATKIFVKYELEYKGYGYGYDEAIANLVNNLWQDLTEEERQQVKGILE